MKLSRMAAVTPLLLAGMIFAGSAAIAQGDGQPPPPGQGGPPPGGGFGGRRGGGFMRMGGPMSAVTTPVDVLASALKLTDAQKTSITDIQTKFREDSRAAMQAAQSTGAPGDREAMMAQMKALNDKATADINAVLDDHQKAALPGVLKTLGSLRTVGIPLDLYGKLNLTGEQKSKINTIAADLQTKMRDMRQANQGGDPSTMRQQMMDLRNATHEAAMAVLNDDQRKMVADHPMNRRGPGGPGGPGGPPGGGPPPGPPGGGPPPPAGTGE